MQNPPFADPDDFEEEWDEDGPELDLSDCPYYTRGGVCNRGCWTEPSCVTDEPLEGWPSQRERNKN